MPISELSNFTFYFTPKKEGKYVVSGRVFYEKKRTFESAAVMNVQTKKSDFRTWATLALYALIMAIILALIVKIRKERKKHWT